jgi:hypothetical protein
LHASRVARSARGCFSWWGSVVRLAEGSGRVQVIGFLLIEQMTKVGDRAIG